MFMMSLKPPSLLDFLDSTVVLAGRLLLVVHHVLITIVEVAAMREVDLDGHWRFFLQLYKRVVASQSCYTVVAGIAGIIQRTRVINALS